MFTPALGRNDAALFTPAFALPEYDITAGAGSDNSEQTCATLDLRTAFATTRFSSVTALLFVTATLGAGENIVVSGIWEQTVNGSTWTEIGTDATLLTLTAVGAGTYTGAAELGLTLAEAEGRVRFKFTGNMSRANTDTAKIASGYLLSSPDRV
jgi:hypothetical protein